MDKCEFSEFSYGYCVTEDLASSQGHLTVAPIFPSLLQEGQPGFGYDVALQRPGAPLFLQFKLVDQMVRGNANETKLGHFVPAFYRMHLRSRAVSDQHQSLISLEQAGNEVYYAAPGFHTTADLNSAYGSREVWSGSFRIKPCDIGPLPDDRRHHVSFRTPTGQWRLYSEESSREGHALDTAQIETMLLERIKQRGQRNLRDQLPELDQTLLSIARERNVARRQEEQIDIQPLVSKVSPLQRVAYMARQFFDCQLLFAS